MRNFLAIALCCLVSTLAHPAAAQSLPPSLEQAPPQLPNLLSGVEAYQLLTSQTFGFDPVVAANIVLRSETAYGAYFTLDQLLAMLPDND